MGILALCRLARRSRDCRGGGWGVAALGSAGHGYCQPADPPGAKFWLGTDQLGRDMLARVIYGARVSLTVAFGTVLIARRHSGYSWACPPAISGEGPKRLLMGAADIGLAFPPIILILLVAAYAGASVVNLILVLGILGIPIYMRIARAVTLTFAQREFVVAARALGASHLRIMRRELLPNVALPVTVVAVIGMSRSHRD